ncbi:MAG: cupin domain-containing protein [Alphaproteobacteria bacterium]|nr:cupin domain-containing protein [Alphaproteobacteria bacterium]MBV9371954.1 cupin domain-containing protein [Alphaproteobacteria bacterium]MBV9900401.1 cupin domain-containing protein [Alphaproteobacteria bacterium]
MSKPMLGAAGALLVVVTGAAGAQTIVDTTSTMAGQPIEAPAGPLELKAAKVTLAAGAPVPVHMHFWARYVYVESGQLQVTMVDGGRSRTFRSGEMIVEPIGKWHFGKAGPAGAVLIGIEQVPPGRCNTIEPPAGAKPNDC